MTARRHVGVAMLDESIAAIRAGAKIETRRIVEPQPKDGGTINVDTPTWIWRSKKLEAGYCHTSRDAMERLILSTWRWQEGDLLWVKERHLKDGPERFVYPDTATGLARAVPPDYWRRARWMPKEAARLWLEVLLVRVERIQEVRPYDVLNEGLFHEMPPAKRAALPRARLLKAWADGWDAMHARRRRGWSTNPWVVVTTFRPVPPPAPDAT